MLESNINLVELHKNIIAAIEIDNSSESLEMRLENAWTRLHADQFKAEKNRIKNELIGVGPLQELIDDANVTEILINDYNKICFEKNGKLLPYRHNFLSEESYTSFLQRLFRESSLKPDLERPYADGVWRGFRVHIILPPLAPFSPSLSLRRQNSNPWTLNKLVRCNWCSPEEADILQRLIAQKANILVVGATGSGKTSVLNALLNLVRADERVICIEDTSEVILPNLISNKLLTRVGVSDVLPDYVMSDLLKQCLRMRPDRIVVGEVRGPEAKDLLMAFATGHEGGLSTLHADSARQALIRLEMLIQLGAPQWSIQAIRHLIFLSISHIVVVKKMAGERKLFSIDKITSVEGSGYCLEKINSPAD